MGVAVASFIPFLLQLFYIRINTVSVAVAICITTLLLNIQPLIARKYKPKWTKWTLPLQLYDYPFIILLGFLVILSAWLCFYSPVNVRDTLSGPELLAKYTVNEQTMLNSVFSVDLETTNNYLKPPYLTSLQVVYKLFVMSYGAMWLPVLAISFTTWLYCLLRQSLHGVLAGILLVFFVAIREVYSYTHVILFDYSNMIFFFYGVYFLSKYVSDKKMGTFFFSALSFGIATYTRTETVVLVALLLPLVIYYLNKAQLPKGRIVLNALLFIAIPAFFYFIWMNVYLKFYMPVTFNLGQQVNTHVWEVGRLVDRLELITTQLVFNPSALVGYGYLTYLFMIVAIIDAVRYRRYTDEAKITLYSIFALYIGFAILGYILPWMDVVNTTKRALFKLFPIMLLYFCNSPLLLSWSASLKNWEIPVVKLQAKQVLSKTVSVPRPSTKKKK